MQLPFTQEQFFDLFAAYNEALWPALLALWTASIVVGALLFSSRRTSDRWVSALLAVHWGWSALAYHVAFFTRINPAAWLFAALFLLQAALFFWWGVVHRRLSFAPCDGRWATVARVLIAYSLVYPGVNALESLSVSRIPTFGVPCPTTIFTAGVLLLAAPGSWHLSIIPVIWSVIGGSAASLLDVRADYVLPIAGVALVVFSLRRPRRDRGRVPATSECRIHPEERTMARRILESLRGVGEIHAGGVLLRQTHYELFLWVDEETSVPLPPATSVNIDGHIDIAGMGEAVVLAGPQDLTLRLEDGRRLAFVLTSTVGGIVGRGGLQPA